MHDEFTIRQATPADASRILMHRRAMFEAMGHKNRAEMDLMVEAFEDWIVPKLENGEYRGWFALNSTQQIVAGAGLFLHEWPPGVLDRGTRRGYIMNVYTEPENRHHGLARRLMADVLDWCRGQGIVVVALHASNDGRSLYDQLGFRATNEMRLTLGNSD